MFIDAHAHLDRYDENLESALTEITQHDIFTISNSMDLPSYRRNLKIAKKNKLVLPTFGVHPWNAPQYVNRLDELVDAVEESPILGEIGLDYYFVEDESFYPAQREVLEFFLAAARDQKKIINLHTKGAEQDILQLLNQYDILRVIIHWYSGPLDVFDKLVNQGMFFTIGVAVLRSKHIRTIAQKLPAEQLLTETDNPGGLKWLSGNDGMPHHIEDVVQMLATLRKTTTDDIKQTVQTNFTHLIGDDPWLPEIYQMFFE